MFPITLSSKVFQFFALLKKMAARGINGKVIIFQLLLNHWSKFYNNFTLVLPEYVMVSCVSLSLSHWYPGSGVVLDCIDS